MNRLHKYNRFIFILYHIVRTMQLAIQIEQMIGLLQNMMRLVIMSPLLSPVTHFRNYPLEISPFIS